MLVSDTSVCVDSSLEVVRATDILDVIIPDEYNTNLSVEKFISQNNLCMTTKCPGPPFL